MSLRKKEYEQTVENMPSFLNVKNRKGELKENEKGGIKADDGKLQWSLVPWEALDDTVKVLMMGAKKYSPDNWRKVERRRYVDSLLRHLTLWMNGEALDPESGLSHLSHAQCNLLFLNSLYGNEPFNREEYRS